MSVRLSRPPQPASHIAVRESPESLGSLNRNAAQPAAPPSATPPLDPNADPPSPFASLLRGLGREVTTGESQMRSAINSTKSGHDLGPSELLALQAGVYRYTDTVDLASKLVDRATSSVKTVIQGQ